MRYHLNLREYRPRRTAKKTLHYFEAFPLDGGDARRTALFGPSRDGIRALCDLVGVLDQDEVRRARALMRLHCLPPVKPNGFYGAFLGPRRRRL